MMNRARLGFVSTLLIALSLTSTSLAEVASSPSTVPTQKELFLPEKIWKVPDGNDFADPQSEFS